MIPPEIKPLDLGDRFLWPDGDVTVDPDKLTEYIFKLSGSLSKLRVTHLTPEIKSFNQISDHPISVKSDLDLTIFPPDWVLPDRYKYLDVGGFIMGLVDSVEKDSLYDRRLERLSHEIWLFKKLELDNVLRCLIYVIDVMREKNVVWGVGRGSSCSSYLLYLLGLHLVDPVKYDIKISDFLKDT